jgi:exodeoxyribonuclease VII small subunit
MEQTYDEALIKLQTISADLENETISVDELSEKVKQASKLILYCQTKLKNTDDEVKKILSQMETKSTNE